MLAAPDNIVAPDILEGFVAPMDLIPLEILEDLVPPGSVIMLEILEGFAGREIVVLVATAVLYAPFLAFIDHFSHHYFLPLIGLAGLAACASIAQQDEERPWMKYAAVAVALAVAVYAAAQTL